ncbi:MAG: hypothetical protein ABW072_04475 [Sedimenticola sp.]
MNINPNFEKNYARTIERSVDRTAELERVERHAIANYSGPIGELLSALGMLRIGDHVGWKTLVLVHSKRTLRKYEEILGLKVKDFFPEEGPSHERSIGYRIARKLNNFWKAVSGDTKIENKREISED